MELVFTPHPLLEAPTDEEILLLGQSDPSALEELHRVREGLIRASQEDPLGFGRVFRDIMRCWHSEEIAVVKPRGVPS